MTENINDDHKFDAGLEENRTGSAERTNVERDLFLKAIEFDNKQDREAFLIEHCADRPELLDGIRGLLKQHDQKETCIIERPLFDSSFTPLTELPDHQSGSHLGHYQLQKLLGEGAMGQVWVARQTDPVRREVALKLVKAGMETPGLLHRFELEKQAIAAMHHPGIAKVFDAGSTEQGQPYFVMELVDGKSLTDFCSENRLSIRQRLELFVSVANAVQHAHQKGVIHRDLKPSNILVTRVDGQVLPKIIDFGVAKAIGGTFSDDSMATQFGAIVGTLEYMAPEQAGFGGQDVDTRADIYSLGVILYELLCGLRPFASEQLAGLELHERLQLIKEASPTRPSLRLNSAAEIDKLATDRGTTPRKLTSLLANELDWIVVKALEKERHCRYDTASDLVADIKRFLSGVPVSAHPPSRVYRFRKFISKNKGLAASVTAVFSALILGIAGTTYGLFQAKTESKKSQLAEQVALKEKSDAENARNRAIDAQNEEVRQREFAEAIADFVKNDFLALTTVEGQYKYDDLETSSLDKDSTLYELLDRAANKLKSRKDLEPLIEAELNWIIGFSYRAVGQYYEAIPFLERCSQLRHELLGEDHEQLVFANNSLAVAYDMAGYPEKAIPLHEQSVQFGTKAFGENDRDTLVFMVNLASVYRKTGRVEECVELLKQAHQRCEEEYGHEDYQSLLTMAHLGAAYGKLGEAQKAVNILQKALELQVEHVGADHPETLATMNSLSVAYNQNGQSDQALPLIEETARLRREKLGNDHPDTLISLNNLAFAYQNAGQTDRAVPVFEEARAVAERQLGKDHVYYLLCTTNLAVTYRNNGDMDKSMPLFEEMVTLNVAIHGDVHPKTLAARDSLGGIYLTLKLYDKATPFLREHLETRLSESPDSWRTFYVQSILGAVLAKTEQYESAKPFLTTGYEGLKDRVDTIPPAARSLLNDAVQRVIEWAEADGTFQDLEYWHQEKLDLNSSGG